MQLFLAVINVVLVLQRLPCANAQLACTPIILAFCLLALEVRSDLKQQGFCSGTQAASVCMLVN